MRSINRDITVNQAVSFKTQELFILGTENAIVVVADIGKKSKLCRIN